MITDPWSGFSADPRNQPQLRATDADRDELSRIIGEAFAEGKLDQQEYDQRLSDALGTRRLGEITDLLEDLVPSALPPAVQRDQERQVELGRRRRVMARRRRKTIVGAAVGWVSMAALFMTIWLITVIASGTFIYFWPIWPMMGTAIPAAITIFAALNTSTDPEDDDA